MLVASDGAPGIIKAIETCFPRSARQRCLAHRMRNLAAKVPEDLWPDFKARVQAAYQAPSRAIARDLAEGPAQDYEAERWRAVKITDFERRQTRALRAELDQEYEAQTGLNQGASKAQPPTQLPSTSRT